MDAKTKKALKSMKKLNCFFTDKDLRGHEFGFKQFPGSTRQVIVANSPTSITMEDVGKRLRLTITVEELVKGSFKAHA